MERPGVHPRWLKQNKISRKPPKPNYTPEATAKIAADIEFFATHPDTRQIYERTTDDVFQDPSDPWWWNLSPLCDGYAAHMADRFQHRTLETGQWDHEHASKYADVEMLCALIRLVRCAPDVPRRSSRSFLSCTL